MFGMSIPDSFLIGYEVIKHFWPRNVFYIWNSYKLDWNYVETCLVKQTGLLTFLDVAKYDTE